MSQYTIAAVVEGYGEVQSLPVLIPRIAYELLGFSGGLRVEKPHRAAQSDMRDAACLSRYLRLQALKVSQRGGEGGVLVLRDGDDKQVSCPVELARLLAPAGAGLPVQVEVVIACREYEAWFLAAVESLRAHKSVRDDATSPPEPEARRDAKRQLEALMNENYKPTLHQAAFSHFLDLDTAWATSRSFRRLVHAVELLLT
ncbi:MAG: DUF4276 family protein [Streptomyces sp.]|nr:DUF4276 family protein [Streptomyces sp.]